MTEAHLRVLEEGDDVTWQLRLTHQFRIQLPALLYRALDCSCT